MKNKDTYFVVCFDEVITQEDYKIIADKYPMQGLNVIKDLPNSGKPIHNNSKTKSYA